MKRRLTIFAITTLAVVALIGVVLTINAPAQADGAKRMSGTATIQGNCPNPEDMGAVGVIDFDDEHLNGCFYVFPETGKCSSGGVYRETGTNLFVGRDNPENDKFKMTYFWVAKFEDCEDGIPSGPEYHGRCHHPIIPGSGEGAFEGVTGRIDMKDIVEKGGMVSEVEYRGHLKW